MMADLDEGMNLVERAMTGVRIVACPRCRGAGSIGLASLSATCPECRGSRVVTERNDAEGS